MLKFCEWIKHKTVDAIVFYVIFDISKNGCNIKLTSLPRNRYDPVYQYYYKDFKGSSFLANPHALLVYRHKWRDKELADYIGLASFRNVGEYLATGKLTLDLSHSPIGKDAINNNRLLRIDRNEIHFLYEDYTGEHTWQV